MSAIKRTLGRKAAKTTAKHSVHGVAAKAARAPLRSVTLLAIGALLGGFAVWLVGRHWESDANEMFD